MSILKVARMGHPVLRTPARPIPPEAISSDEVQRLAADLLDTVDEYDGAGLAAPQVHASWRMVVIQLDTPGEPPGHQVWINPEVTPVSDEEVYTFEGCLSVEGLRGLVGRAAEVEVHALGIDGEPITLRLGGYPAVVAQHECDHLDGILYVDKAVPRTLMFLEEYRRYASQMFEEE